MRGRRAALHLIENLMRVLVQSLAAFDDALAP